jgi:hypothetical protein
MTPEEEKAKGVFFGWAMNFPEQSTRFTAFFDAVKVKFSAVDSWAALGLCWGGKVGVYPSLGSPSH